MPLPLAVRSIKLLIRNYFSVDIGIGVEQGNTLEKSSNYILSIGPEDRSEQILREARIRTSSYTAGVLKSTETESTGIQMPDFSISS